MNYNTIKNFTRSIGLYQQARWFNRHFLNRDELAEERSDLFFYAKMLNEGDLVFDAGANYGEKSRIFLKRGLRVVAFEPQPDCMAELKSRCANHPNLRTVQAALASKSGMAQFYVRSQRDKSGLVKDWQKHVHNNREEAMIDVPVVTFDQMIEKYGAPSFIKMDIEGSEYEAFQGLTQKIPLISFEYHFSDNEAKSVRECVEYLSTLGEIKINVTPSEKLHLKYWKWLSKDVFLKEFYDHIRHEPGFGYGDVWIRMKEQE